MRNSMTRDELKRYVESHFDDKLTPLDTGRFDPMFEVRPDDLLEAARGLRDDDELRFDFLCNLGAVDTGEHLEIVYSIASIPKSLRLDFKVILPYDKAEIESVQEIWPAANWHEREVWELYGIDVKNHGNLKRFLLPDDWDQGHPMRKDWDAPDFIRMSEE
jgi:NADH-quinone oxidoreductase subunit C